MGTNAKFNINVGDVKETIQIGNNTFTEGVFTNASGSDVDLPVGAILARDENNNIIPFNHLDTGSAGVVIGFNTDARTIPANGESVIKVVTSGFIDADVVKFDTGVDWDTAVIYEDADSTQVFERTIQELVESRGFEIEFGKVL